MRLYGSILILSRPKQSSLDKSPELRGLIGNVCEGKKVVQSVNNGVSPSFAERTGVSGKQGARKSAQEGLSQKCVLYETHLLGGVGTIGQLVGGAAVVVVSVVGVAVGHNLDGLVTSEQLLQTDQGGEDEGDLADDQSLEGQDEEGADDQGHEGDGLQLDGEQQGEEELLLLLAA